MKCFIKIISLTKNIFPPFCLVDAALVWIYRR